MSLLIWSSSNPCSAAIRASSPRLASPGSASTRRNSSSGARVRLHRGPKKKSTTPKTKSGSGPNPATSLSSFPTPYPDRNCPRCPRLATFRKDNRAAHPGLFNAPVPQFGGVIAALLIVGLAPGLQGANRTGRPFTGDYAGDLLYQTLLDYGFASGHYEARPDDGLKLVNCRIGNAVHCVPPQNKPPPAELN